MEQEALKFILSNCRFDMVIVLVGLWYIYKIINEIANKTVIFEQGLRSSLLCHIDRIHRDAMRKSTISREALICVEDCYKQYHACGGNGYATNMMNEIRNLKIE